ncbi:MAG: transcriptional regulator [Sphingobacteriaceae bacterium]|nr:transcriptional regulator [Sphingobacteriaceae bacterium]
MALPINIEQLVHGNTVEWERLEFKKGWNPEDVLHSMCAFANDLQNWGGGYIIIGVAEENGQPILPPQGLQANQLDSIQKKVVELGNKISPTYFPVIQPYTLHNKQILVLWCPAGDNRVYTAPDTLGAGAINRSPYVRIGSNSVIARGETLRKLQDLTARIPFDDRVNNRAKLADLSLGLIQAHLQEIKSDLFEESRSMSFEDLCRTMHLAKGPDEDIRPVNAGLLFFSELPHDFFERCWIEVVWHQDLSGSKFRETVFKGPLHKQLRDTLSFFQTNIISEQIIKLEDAAAAKRFFNFPFAALEEALSNAVYHKSYELGAPIEVQIWPDKIEILSYPGPMPPVNAQILKSNRRIVAREYRNRRIGDFLKELRLTEGRGTGFPTIYKSMADNGSPDPIFDTNAECTYFLVTLPIHEDASIGAGIGDFPLLFSNLSDLQAFSNGASNGASNGVGMPAIDLINQSLHERVVEMLTLLLKKRDRSSLFETMKLSNQSKNRAKYLDPLLELGWVSMSHPNEKTHPLQTYLITDAGKRILNLVNQS